MCKTQGASLGDVPTHIPDHKSDAPSSGWLSLLTTDLCTIVLSMSGASCSGGGWVLVFGCFYKAWTLLPARKGRGGLADRS